MAPPTAPWERPRWGRSRRCRSLVAAQRRAALGSGAAFWEPIRAMGGAGAIDRWARRRRRWPSPTAST